MAALEARNAGCWNSPSILDTDVLFSAVSHSGYGGAGRKTKQSYKKIHYPLLYNGKFDIFEGLISNTYNYSAIVYLESITSKVKVKVSGSLSAFNEFPAD